MSQMTPEETTIGEHKYEMYMLAPIKSHNLLMDVAKMAGPALGQAIGALFGGAASNEEILEKEVTTDLLSGALGKLFEDLNKSTLEQVITIFREVTHVDGKPLDKIFDAHFRGKLEDMYLWMAWGFRVQWGKSLSALVSGVSGQGAFAALTKKPGSESPST
jgi:hypothetical protein